MPQAIAETTFDVLYLSAALIVGITMLIKGKSRLVKKAGCMATLLGAGDAFHLIPRCYALFTTGLEKNAAALGIGKFITSITMTIFYLILYFIWRDYYQIKERKDLTKIMYGLTVLRIIPFAIMGIIIIIIFAQEIKRTNDKVFRFIPIAVALSFGFYLPVVLFSGIAPIVGILMIPKTLAYVWVIWMGWQLYKQSQ